MAMQESIRTKLRRAILLACAGVLLLTVLSFVIYELVTFRRAHFQSISTIAEVIAANSTGSLSFKVLDDAQDVLNSLIAEPSIRKAALYDGGGVLFAHYPPGISTNEFPAHPGRDRMGYEDGFLIMVLPVEEATRHGTLLLQANLAPLYASLRDYGVIVALILAASFALAWFLSSSLQRGISAPILALAAVARRVSEQRDYSVRAEKQTEDEIGVLTEALNHMLGQIAARDSALQAAQIELEQRVEDRTAELAETNRELEAFTYSVSHDLRAPLRHINAYAQILQEECASDLRADAQKYLSRIRQGTKNMGALVDDLLNLARVGRQELSFEPCDLDQLVAEVIQDLRGETAGRGIDWRVASLGVLECDAGLLRQVFANVIGNAVKYTRPRDPAIIEIGREEGPGGEPVIFVRDNGVGFNMKYAAKLFGVFQRLHRADEFEGTGVGLATVERIIRKHGGRIWAESELDKGAAFYFTLDARQEIAIGGSEANETGN